MKRDTRLSTVLHALLHMAEHSHPMTSDELAECMNTNPVVVRRTMAGLRDLGLVRSDKGHHGGWSLACDLKDVTLQDIHRALGEPVLFAIANRRENPACLVEQAVNAAMDDAFRQAEAVLVARLGSVSLADLSADFHRRMQDHKQKHGRNGNGL